MVERRYLVDRDFNSFRAMVPAVVRQAMELSYLTGQGLTSLLALQWRDVKAIGLPRNQWTVDLGRVLSLCPRTIPISDALEAVLKDCKRMKPDLPRHFVLRLEDGYQITSGDFNGIWRIYMRRWKVRGEGRLAFSFGDIRKKVLADKNRGRSVLLRGSR